MKYLKYTTIFKALALAVIVSSCAASSYPVAVSGNKSVKEGEAVVKIVFGFGPMHQDLSIKTAAENGGITRVATVDFIVETKALGFVQKYTTLVTGE